MTTLFITTDNVPGYTRGVLAHIESETAKAFCLASYTETGKRVTAWFPKKALVNVRMADGGKENIYDLAKWFRPTGWTERFIALTATSSLF